MTAIMFLWILSTLLFKMGLSQTTPPPTINATCDYDGESLSIGDKVSVSCAFGYSGTNDNYTCLSNGEMEFVQGCFIISFSDDFIGFDANLWTVYDPSDVSGEVALADGVNELQFIPNDAAFVSVIHSVSPIMYPARVRVVVRKESDECNQFGISMGKKWRERSQSSTRLGWNCDSINDKQTNSKQMSLYNSSFRLYDSKCWDDTIMDAMEVVYTVADNKTQISTNVSNCYPLSVFVTDIFNTSNAANGWIADAYLWLGSYEDQEYDYDTINESVVGRFDGVAYTQCFADFNINESVIYKGDTINNSTYTKSYQFRIPFAIRLGIRKPLSSSGVFAQFVNLGGSEYIDESTNNVVQIVWNEKKQMRLAYTALDIYQTGYGNSEDCAWDTENTEFDVTIQVDSTHIMVSDALCDSILVAAHDLVVNQTTLSLGFLNNEDYDDTESTEFTYIEAYQLASAYAGNLADSLPVSNTLTAISSTSTTITPTANGNISITADTESVDETADIESVDESNGCNAKQHWVYLFLVSVIIILLFVL